MATLDSRTRDAHADLDGQIRDVDEPFDSELGPIDYPGDPTADPGNIWNCRCTLVYVYPDYPSEMERRDAETGEVVGDMTYREWEESKRKTDTEEPSKKDFTNPSDDSTIKASSVSGDGVSFVGKIDNKIYSCIAGDLVTDEVIITDKQIEHSNRHEDAYNKYGGLIPSVLKNPDEIFKDKRPYTGLVVKEIYGEGPNKLLLVLRIKVPTDPENYKNSIINCWKISEERYKNYQRNKKSLYKAKE